MSHSEEQQHEFTSKDVEILSKETVFSGFFNMVKYRFRHRLFNGGWSEVIEREMFERGNAAAVLPYDPVTDKVVLIEQIRVGALTHSSPWQLEIVAGIIDKGESAECVARREAVEEANVSIGDLLKVTSYYPSSGGCSERLDVYVGKVDASNASGIHGLDYEGEDIKVHVVNRETAYQWVVEGKFENGASIIALQWLQLNYQSVREQWQI
ncbi:ADP-ribose diphosphatase [Vibrio sp. OCN044]|uniref:ADP-ribose pyrophosphatase n=1 Tax=Vibrio tetraodonis subsp. pristinus TaxID=2695891 RepID=A0A6L8LTU9_9VIBR|nr:ADP-ribose diphosphatase [Vibrio tetraodonis]MYM59528.1 ADP-ribose diphosphatase [Vibrio tetraodonis subsp. pristinus]